MYSVIIPCYNSASFLNELVDRCNEVLTGQRLDYEILLINDASPDNDLTWSTIKNIVASNKNVKGIELQFNVGQFRALIAGFENSGGDYIITMDDDLQHPPEEIPKLINKIQNEPNVDAVIGSYIQKHHSLFRNFGRKLVNLIFKSIYKKPDDISSTSFRILKRSLVDSILMHRTLRPIMGALILQSTKKIVNVDVKHNPREKGRSGYSLKQLVNSTLDNVVDSTVAPLRLFSIIGIFSSVISFSIIIYYFSAWCIGNISVPGYVSNVLLISFFGGMMLLGIGILGEYISRIVTETSNSPRYIIREIYTQNKYEHKGN